MKFAILGDCHFGARNDSHFILDNQERFFSEVFFPKLLELGITEIWQLGDFMDRRKYVNFRTLERTKSIILDRCREHGIKMKVLVGNHDIYWRESIRLNSLTSLFADYSDIIECIDEPKSFKFDDVNVDMIPWICKENEEDVGKFLTATKNEDRAGNRILLGHLELEGFAMLRGVLSSSGMDESLISHYNYVVSGHYHTRSHSRNIEFLGTPYELTWSDCDDTKGFGIFDTKTCAVEFIENPISIFHKITFDDSLDVDSFDYSSLNSSYIKVFIDDRQDEDRFDRFLEGVYKENPIDLIIQDNTMAYVDVEEGILEARDPLSILLGSVDPSRDDEPMIKTMIHDLFNDAMALGVTE